MANCKTKLKFFVLKKWIFRNFRKFFRNFRNFRNFRIFQEFQDFSGISGFLKKIRTVACLPRSDCERDEKSRRSFDPRPGEVDKGSSEGGDVVE